MTIQGLRRMAKNADYTNQPLGWRALKPMSCGHCLKSLFRQSGRLQAADLSLLLA